MLLSIVHKPSPDDSEGKKVARYISELYKSVFIVKAKDNDTIAVIWDCYQCLKICLRLLQYTRRWWKQWEGATAHGRIFIGHSTN